MINMNILFYTNYLKGLNLYRKKEFKNSLQSFENAANYHNLHAKLNFKIGMCYFKLEDWEKAEFFIKKAIEIDPAIKNWQRQLSQTQRHVKDNNVKKYTTEINDENDLRVKIDTDPSNPSYYNDLAILLHKQGKWSQEIEALKKAISLNSQNSNWFYRLANALEIMNYYQEAAQTYGKAINLNEKKADAEYYYRQGFCYEQEGYDGQRNLYAASLAYEQAIIKDSKLNAKRFGIGVFHQARGHWIEAVTAYKEYFKTQPFDAELAYKIGMAYDRCYLWSEAEKYYKIALSLNNKQIYWYYRLGFVLERQARWNEAEVAYEYAAQNSDKYMGYWFYRWGYVLGQIGDYEKAVKALLKTRKKQSLENPEIHTYESQYSSRTKDNKNSEILPHDKSLIFERTEIYHLNSILMEDYTRSGTWYQLGNAYEIGSEWENAAYAYQNAIDRQNEYMPEWYYRLGYVLAKAEKYEMAFEKLKEVRILQKPYGTLEDDFNNNLIKKELYTYKVFFERLTLDDSKILYESFHGNNISCNPYALLDEALVNLNTKNFKHIVVINDDRNIPDEYRKCKNIIFVKRRSYIYLYHLASSKILINNVSFPEYFKRKNGQIYLNTWHGTPLKYLGKDIKDVTLFHGNGSRNFVQTTHLLFPNSHTKKIILEKYDVDGLYNGTLLDLGYPRIDFSLETSESELKIIKNKLGIKNSKPIVFYAPTWRGDHSSAFFDFDRLEADLKLIASMNVQLLFRAHHMIEKKIRNTNLSKYLANETIDTNKILSITDILITDYSSIFFDYFALMRPIIYYIYDVEDYVDKRGIYIEFNQLAGKVAKNQKELIQHIKESKEVNNFDKIKYLEARAKYCPYDDGSASKNILEKLINDSNKGIVFNKITTKKNILIYAGDFEINGYFNELLRKNDYSNYNIFLLIDPSNIKRGSDKDRMLREINNDGVKIISYVKGFCADLEEDFLENQFKKYRKLYSDSMYDILSKAFYDDLERFIKDCQIDYIINCDLNNDYFVRLLGSAKDICDKKIAVMQSDIIFNKEEMFPYLDKSLKFLHKYDNVIITAPISDDKIESIIDNYKIDRRKIIKSQNFSDLDHLLADKINPVLSANNLEKIKISIIVPIYNVENYLENCIDSLKKQSLDNFEVIFVNDASTDNSISVLIKCLEYTNFNYNIINLPINKGLSHARNIGIKNSKGNYILFLDSDDWLAKNAIELLTNKIEKSWSDVIYMNFYRHYPSGKLAMPQYALPYRFSTEKNFSVDENPDIIFIINLAQIKIYRKSFIDENKFSFIEGRIYEDIDWTFKIITTTKKISIINEPLYYYRQSRPDSILSTKDIKHFQIIDQYEEVLEYFTSTKNTINYDIKERIYNYAVNALYAAYVSRNRIPDELKKDFFNKLVQLILKFKSYYNFKVYFNDKKEFEFDLRQLDFDDFFKKYF